MKHITATIALSLFFITAGAQGPEGYEDKTAKLADNFVKCSKEGNYNKTYKALRKIQKYEFRLDKDQLVTFYSDLHEAVCDACDRYRIDDDGKNEMKIIIDALFSDNLKESINR